MQMDMDADVKLQNILPGAGGTATINKVNTVLFCVCML
jgi:hypothetical protein